MIWRDIPGYEGLYQVSDTGLVKSLARVMECKDGRLYSVQERTLAQNLGNSGYPQVVLCRLTVKKTLMVHKLMMLAFVGPAPEGQQVLHRNDIKDDNRLENLRYGTSVENMQDALMNGRNAMSSRTHCKNDHEFTEANTHWHGSTRICRTCKNASKALSRSRAKAPQSL